MLCFCWCSGPCASRTRTFGGRSSVLAPARTGALPRCGTSGARSGGWSRFPSLTSRSRFFSSGLWCRTMWCCSRPSRGALATRVHSFAAQLGSPSHTRQTASSMSSCRTMRCARRRARSSFRSSTLECGTFAVTRTTPASRCSGGASRRSPPFSGGRGRRLARCSTRSCSSASLT
eukprot:Amastigsp_a685827_81.p3 type:complete len:175 gc:universal Amastigsp_a685827_81:452-976(+)